MAFFYACCAKIATTILLLKTPAESTLWYMALLCVFVRLCLHLYLSKLNAKLTFSCELAVRQEILQAISRQGPFSQGVNPGVAALLSEIATSITPFFTAFGHTLRQVMVLPAILLVFMAVASPLSALALALMCPLIPLFMVFIGKKAKELNDRQLLQIKRLSERFFEALTKLPFIFIFDLGKRELSAVRRMSRHWRVQTMQILYVAFLSALALEFFATVGVAFCAITLGFAVYEQGFSYEKALFVLLCAPEFFLPLRRLGQNYHAKQRALAAAESLNDLLSLNLPKRAITATDNAPRALTQVSVERLATAQLMTLTFNHVTLRYPDGRLGLNDASFTLKGTAINVLSGPSGSGKSTILAAIAGLLTPESGTITISLKLAPGPHDSGNATIISGDVNALSKEQRQALYTFVPQRPYLFYGTLRDNLRLAKAQATDEELIKALQKAGAASLLSNLPQGLDTMLGDDHGGISGGQARLLALSRALLRKAPLILLDEPSASLDQVAEQSLAQALVQLKRHHTVIIAAHRAPLIALADKEVTLGGA